MTKQTKNKRVYAVYICNIFIDIYKILIFLKLKNNYKYIPGAHQVLDVDAFSTKQDQSLKLQNKISRI